jgi:4-amino-4-deoxy-L-arabinose transferase-like glycosyltransferase
VRALLATRYPRGFLVVLCLALWVPGFFNIPPTDRDESRFAQATKQMLETGDYVRIENGREARNRKPIGIYWLQVPPAALAQTLGLATTNPIWPYRVPSALGGIFAVLATFLCWRRAIGDGAAFLAAAMLGGSVILSAEHMLAKTDAVLLAVTTVALSLLGRAYLSGSLSRYGAAGFWLACGAGILIKGPVTPAVAGLTALSLALADRRIGWWRQLRLAAGIPLMLIVVLPWLVAIGFATHGRFFSEAVGGDFGSKLIGGSEEHGAPPGLHLLLLPLLIFPSTIPVLLSLAAAWRSRAEAVTRFLLAWLIPSWIVFELVPTKLPHYTLPLYPALCLLAGRWVVDAGRIPSPRWLERLAIAAFIAVAAVLGFSAVALPWVTEGVARPAVEIAGVVVLVAAGVIVAGVLRLVRRQDMANAALTGIVLMALLTWPLLQIELPDVSALWIAPRVEAALKQHWPEGWPPGARFGAAGFHEPSLMFLCGTDTVWLPTGAEAARFLAAGPERVVAVSGRDLASFASESTQLHLKPHPFSVVAGYNYSHGSGVTLTLFGR